MHHVCPLPHLGVVQAAGVVDLQDDQAVAEGLDAQLGQQGCLGGAHLLEWGGVGMGVGREKAGEKERGHGGMAAGWL